MAEPTLPPATRAAGDGNPPADMDAVINWLIWLKTAEGTSALLSDLVTSTATAPVVVTVEGGVGKLRTLSFARTPVKAFYDGTNWPLRATVTIDPTQPVEWIDLIGGAALPTVSTTYAHVGDEVTLRIDP